MIFRRSILRRVFAASALLMPLSGAPASAETGVRPIVVDAKPVALDPANPGKRRVGGLIYRGGLELHSPDKAFGGYSGMTVSADGSRLLAISDRGTWLAADLGYDDGQLVRVTGARVAALIGVDGSALRGSWSDAEAFALNASGGMVVGFEHRHRIYRYPPADPPFSAAPAELAAPDGLSKAPPNKGLEAIALLKDGRKLLLTEDYRNDELDTIGWISNPAGNSFSALSYAVSGLYHPTGAATLPDGDVLVLERRYVAIKGGSMRVRRIPREEITAGARLVGTTIATIAPPLTVDNMEAITVREGPDGEILVYVMSDDNFRTGMGNLFIPRQRTLLMMFQLEER